jgi:ketosteroid isomerase-like protein
MEISELNETEREVYDLSERWCAAIVSNDADAIDAFMSDGWIMVSDRGVSTKESFLAFVRSGQLAHSAMEMDELGKISIYGDTAVLASRIKSKASFGGRTFPANEWTSDVFIKENGEWKCVITHITPAVS